MDFVVKIAEGFTGMFQEGGDTFLGMVTDIIPLLIELITAVNAAVRFVGEERVTRFAQKLTKYFILRYTIFASLAVFFVTNPMAYTFGKFLPHKQKAEFYDSAVSFVPPITGLFPHANPAELFVYLGVSAGLTTLGMPLGPLALMYFVTGVVVILIRGILTEIITVRMMKKQGLLKDE